MALRADEEKDAVRALEQVQGEDFDLERTDEPIQYLEVPKGSRRRPNRAESELSVHHDLEKVVSAATTIGTNAGSEYTEITEVTTTASRKTQQARPPWHHRLNPLRSRKIPEVPEERTISREYNAGYFSLLTFQWINPFMTTGYKRTVELNDIWLVNPDRSSDKLMTALMASFKSRAAKGERNALLWAIWDTLRLDFIIGGTCALFSAMFQVFAPFMTRYLIQYATEAYEAQRNGSPAPDVGRGVGLALGITFMQICQSLATNHFIYRGMMCGGESRAVLINAIFDKTLKLSGRAKAGGRATDGESISNGINYSANVSTKSKRPGLNRLLSSKLHPKSGTKVSENVGAGVTGDGTGWNNGKIVNLMSVDTYRVDQASGLFHMLWTAPIQVSIVLVVLCINIGYSALAGYALLAICMPLLTKAIKSLFIRRKGINKITDQRVTLTQEILGAVRFVKFFGWETR